MGNVSVGPGFDDDESLYVWLCDADGSNCGVDNQEMPVWCFGEAQTRDSSQGSPSRYDGVPVYQSQIWTPGPEVMSWPEDADGNQIDGMQLIRVVCFTQD